jgi:hypothetical protein
MDLPWKEINQINEGKMLQNNQFTSKVSKTHKTLWYMNALKLSWPISHLIVGCRVHTLETGSSSFGSDKGGGLPPNAIIYRVICSLDVPDIQQ